MSVGFRQMRLTLRGLVVLVAASGLIVLTCQSASALSEGRVYEMVSPVYKDGSNAGLVYAAASGEAVVFNSLGTFADDPNNNALLNVYVARRGSTAWSASPQTPPASIWPRAETRHFSPTLSMAIDEGAPAPNLGRDVHVSEGEEWDYLWDYLLHATSLPDEAANFTLAGEPLSPLEPPKAIVTPTYRDSNPSLSHIFLTLSPPSYLLPAALGTESNLYDLASSCSTECVHLVGVNNKGSVIGPQCAPSLGSAAGRYQRYNAVSNDGEEAFFSVGLIARTGTPTFGECQASAQLYVRLAGSRTLEISRPLSPACTEVPCAGAGSRAPADFVGASEDGNLVFFTTGAPLVGVASGNNLYMASIGCPGGGEACEPSQREVTGLTLASRGGEPAEVQNVVAVAPDGSHVYFVARGVLGPGANAQGATPVKGADNLYVYDSRVNKVTGFVGELCSGPSESGAVPDAQCPGGLSGEPLKNDRRLWENQEREAQVNECVESEAGCESGRFLVFSTYAQLLPSDTDARRDVYRYDALTGALDRVSVGEDGASEDGNGEQFDASLPMASESSLDEQRHLNSRAITQNGSLVAFTTEERLSSLARTGVTSAYVWRAPAAGGGEGSVSLIAPLSSAAPAGGEDVPNVVISASGHDVFFETGEGLVPQDTDGQVDVYDARVGGGFPVPPVEPERCRGDSCRGSLTSPAPLLVPGSAVQAAGENFASPADQPAAAVHAGSKPKVKSHGKKAKPKRKGGAVRRAKRARRGVDTTKGARR